jgi:hypothetical protein
LKHNPFLTLLLVVLLGAGLLVPAAAPVNAQDPGATVFSRLDETVGEPVNFRLPAGWTGYYSLETGFVFGNEAFPVTADNALDIVDGVVTPSGEGRVLFVTALASDNGLVPPDSTAAEAYAAAAAAVATDDATLSDPVDISTERINVARGEFIAADGSGENGLLYLIVLDSALFLAQANAPAGADLDDYAALTDAIILSITIGEGVPPADVPQTRGQTDTAVVSAAVEPFDGETVNFVLPPGWSGAYSETSGFVFANEVIEVTPENVDALGADSENLPPGGQAVLVVPLPTFLIGEGDTPQTFFDELSPSFAEDDTTLGEVVEFATERDGLSGVGAAVNDPTDDDGFIYIMQFEGNFFLVAGVAADDEQEGLEADLTAIVNTISYGEFEMTDMNGMPDDMAAVQTITGMDALTGLDITFDYRPPWFATFAPDTGFIFASSEAAFDYAQRNVAEDDLEETLPEGDRAALVLAVPQNFLTATDVEGALAEFLPFATEDIDGTIGAVEGLMVGDFPAARVTVMNNDGDDGFIYMVDAGFAYLVSSATHAPGVAEQLTEDIAFILASARLPGDASMSETDIPAAEGDATASAVELTETMVTTTGEFSIDHPAGWAVDPSSAPYLGSNEAVLQNVREFVPITGEDGIGFSVLTSSGIEDDFGLGPDTSATDGLTTLASAFGLDTSTIMPYEQLEVPAAIIDATDTLMNGNLAVLGVEHPGGLTFYALQWAGDIDQYEPLLIEMLNSVTVSPLTE